MMFESLTLAFDIVSFFIPLVFLPSLQPMGQMLRTPFCSLLPSAGKDLTRYAEKNAPPFFFSIVIQLSLIVIQLLCNSFSYCPGS
jgi:hypothetical protein